MSAVLLADQILSEAKDDKLAVPLEEPYGSGADQILRFAQDDRGACEG